MLDRQHQGSDQEFSVLFPSMTLSYKVCTFSRLVGPFATSGPEGFPNNGLALRKSGSRSEDRLGRAPAELGAYAFSTLKTKVFVEFLDDVGVLYLCFRTSWPI